MKRKYNKPKKYSERLFATQCIPITYTHTVNVYKQTLAAAPAVRNRTTF